jgi:branched-chain amino acid transport system permease protein
MVLLGEFVRVQAGGLLKKLGEGLQADAFHLAFFGILLILIIIFLPNGVVGDFGKLTRPVRALWARLRPAAEGN